ncbi:MAG: DUF47 family protein [Oscillospiraceae bacterium]|nr:DUF47 family protein [Oscillospiraceae bacterium]
MAKGDKFYFENFAECAALSKKAAAYLVECLEKYDPDKIEEMLHNMHQIEHTADIKKHEMNDALAKAFVTPVDREDLDMLSQNLDHVNDKLEEIIQKFYVYDIKSVETSVIDFAKKLVKACDLLCELMDEFENFKRSKKIRELIIELNDVEEECDKLYLASMRALTKSSNDVLTIISWRDIYECFESCADACEHVSECVGSVIMKNT